MLNACTIIAKNYVAFARVLADSLRAHHPDSRLTVLVVDDLDGRIDPAAEPFDVLTPADLDLPEFELMASWYEILELTTAVKPWLLRRMLRDADHVLYFDPDIRFFAPIGDVADAAREHDIVLTPHNLGPMPRDGRKPSEQDILIAGTYNLGFLGLGAGDAAARLLDWWSERLRTQCVVNPEKGLFTDQRWIDFVPGMFEDVHILRDPGLNVAYWNIGSRDVRAEGDAFTVDARPLRFFHFSGYDPRKPERLSKHQDRTDLSRDRTIRALTDAYAEDLLAHGFAEAIEWPYTHARTASGRKLDQASRRLFLAGVEAGALHEPLFTAAGEEAFERWAGAPAGAGADPRITRYLKAVHELRGDLRVAYPSLERDADQLVRWAREDAPAQLGDAARLALPPAHRPDVTEVPPLPEAETPAGDAVPVGVNLVGYLRAELGVGEVARQVVGALDAAAVPLLPRTEIATASRQGHAFDETGLAGNPFPVNLLCVNADQTELFASRAGEDFFAGHYTIGWWWWEIDHFPAHWYGAFEHVDEVWAGSRFVADTLAAIAPCPVLRIPMPVAERPFPQMSREALGLPDGFVFLFAFDFHSVFARKNPLDLVAAYRRAFAPGEGAHLVLKSINHEAHPEAHRRLVDAIADRPDIVLVDRYVPADVKDAMIASCDAYVSLHRSEGFGITLAEAMLLRKPVIATAYGGNLDFMTRDNSLLVDREVVPVGPGSEPYPADARWAQPDLDHAAAQLRRVFDEPDDALQLAERGQEHVRRWHDPQVCGETMAERIALVARLAGVTRRHVLADRAREETGALTRTPLPRSSHRRLDPRRLARAAAVRAAGPVLYQQQRNDRALIFAIEETAKDLQTRLQEHAALAEARRLADARAAQRRIDELERRVAELQDR